MAKNVTMEVQGGKTLIIKVDLTKECGPSSSGKTTIIASTEGNISIPEHEEIKIGLNLYKKR
jgi:ABC-type polar amino acid transport system ATPase subunit